ncbi:MAG: acetylglutamate kinase [Dehalococcoidales bacterium]|nr:acetylglutamate kinase [Dehalococcoidales bacterium]
MKNVTVVKIGGSTFGSHDTTIADIITLQEQGKALVVVHGGGRTVTNWLKRQGIETQFVRGERVTDLPTLEVATAVLAGLANKELTAAINLRGGRAVGISGVDGHLIESRAKNPEMGYVGEVIKVNTAVLEVLIDAGFVPVVSSISLYAVDRPDDAAEIINVNGDPVAGDIAAALGAERLVFLTDVGGINDASGKLISRLSAREAEELTDSGVISGGMIPKINACLTALSAGAITRIIDGKKPHALVNELAGLDGGTTIFKE